MPKSVAGVFWVLNSKKKKALSEECVLSHDYTDKEMYYS